jgi:HEPN domain-containing protein
MTHDLLLLNNLCSSAGIFLAIDPKLLNTLTDFAVRTRYPGDEPTLNDAKEAIEIAKLIRALARKFLGM